MKDIQKAGLAIAIIVTVTFAADMLDNLVAALTNPQSTVRQSSYQQQPLSDYRQQPAPSYRQQLSSDYTEQPRSSNLLEDLRQMQKQRNEQDIRDYFEEQDRESLNRAFGAPSPEPTWLDQLFRRDYEREMNAKMRDYLDNPPATNGNIMKELEQERLRYQIEDDYRRKEREDLMRGIQGR